MLLRDYGEYVCANWNLPDAGIWEPRDQLRHRTHSRLVCWVALDRLLELHHRGLLGRIDAARYEANRAAIRNDIEMHAFDVGWPYVVERCADRPRAFISLRADRRHAGDARAASAHGKRAARSSSR